MANTPKIYIRVQDENGYWQTVEAQDATEAQFRAWLLRLLHRAGWVVPLTLPNEALEGRDD